MNLAASGVPTALQRGGESEVPHKWARWLHNPCRPGGSHRIRARGRIKNGPQVGKVVTRPLPPRGSSQLQSGAHNQKWPTSGQGGYITRVAWGSPPLQSGGQIRKPTSGQGGYITPGTWGSPPLQSGGQKRKCPTSGHSGYITPSASKLGAESEVAHKWARWLHNPCRPRGPHRFRARGRIKGGPQVGKVAT